MERRPRFFRGGAAALVLAALVASLAILAHPTGNASATTTTGAPTLSVVHGCDVGDGQGDWVEATISPNSEAIDPANPPIVQVGLAVSADNTDEYPDSTGPVLLALKGPTTVRLAGPIRGAHVFVREYGSSNLLTKTAVPFICRHVAKTNLGDIQPDLFVPRQQASCVGSSASLTVKIQNSGTSDTAATVLLVTNDGELTGTTPQGQLVPLPAKSTQTVQVGQKYTSTDAKYRFQIRLLTLDGQGFDSGIQTVVCDSQGHQGGGGPSNPPPHPSVSKTVNPPSSPVSTPTGSKPTPSKSTSNPSVRPSATAAATSSGVRRSNAPVVVSSNNPGSGSGSVAGASDNGGPVLGDADSTRQPAAPVPTASPSSKKVIVNAATVTPGVTSGTAAAGALILLAFAGAIAGMVAASRASARRR